MGHQTSASHQPALNFLATNPHFTLGKVVLCVEVSTQSGHIHVNVTKLVGMMKKTNPTTADFDDNLAMADGLTTGLLMCAPIWWAIVSFAF
jgi:hypothetical protein